MLAHVSEDNAVANAATKLGNANYVAGIASTVNNYAEHQIHYDSQKFQYKGLEKIDNKLP
jgi:hypothetical protein